MGEKMVGGIEPFAVPGLNGMAKVQGVPVDDDGGEQVEAGDPVMLTLRRAVADFALTADAQGIFQRMMCLARSEEHTSELQSLMRTSYAVFCLTKKSRHNTHQP